jgi:hypothetical protein
MYTLFYLRNRIVVDINYLVQVPGDNFRNFFQLDEVVRFVWLHKHVHSYRCQVAYCHLKHVTHNYKSLNWLSKGSNINIGFIILYFSILLHCIVQWVLQVMSPSACSFIVCWFPLSFTTCFGLHGHLQVYRILHIFIFKCFRFLLRCEPKKQHSRILKQLKINIWRILHTWRWPYRPKHVVKDSGNKHTIKLHPDGDITCNTHWSM